MWRRIRICVAVLASIALVAIATGQALHAWRTSEGLDQQEGDGGNGGAGADGGAGGGGCNCSAQIAAATAAAATKCAPGDVSCQIQQQSEVVARLQAAVAALSKTANEALAKANKAAQASAKLGQATLTAHNAQQARATAAAAPLAGHGSPPLPAPPVSKGDLAAM